MDIKTYEKRWNARYTQMLLSLYSERQSDFRDPNRKIKDVWGEMVVVMRNQGMLDVDAVQLDRKFRNLKKTYYCIRNKHLAKGPQFHPNWQFYDEMSSILKDEPAPSQLFTMDDFSAMRTFLCDDDTSGNMVFNNMQEGRMLSLGTVKQVIPRPVRPYRKRKSEDAGQLRMQKIRKSYKLRAEPPRELDHIPVVNAAEPETNDLGSKDELSIGSMEEALRHMRALQEYAMIQDNFRAIGLLMQAEQAIQYPPKTDDFKEEET